ncbi:MAG: glycosyltransferase family 1 protein [Pseudomonadota bacterium]
MQSGGLYLNVGHTEFDLPEHARWVKETGVRPIYFLHDLIPIRRPDLCRPGAVARHKARVKSALTNGAAIIVNSQATATDLQQYALQSGKAAPPVRIANLAGGDIRPPKKARNITGKPYFLAVGTHEPRRNFLLLIKVWERLVAKLGAEAPKLTIVGQPWKHHLKSYQALEQSALRGQHLHLVKSCSDQRLGALMSGAQALLMPTLAEGFGLPLVEALALGTPVIASDLPSLRESGKGIPLLLDPENPAVWEQAIVEFEQGSTERERQKEMIKDYSPPTWADHFAQVDPFLEALSSAARGSPASEETQCLIA